MQPKRENLERRHQLWVAMIVVLASWPIPADPPSLPDLSDDYRIEDQRGNIRGGQDPYVVTPDRPQPPVNLPWTRDQ